MRIEQLLWHPVSNYLWFWPPTGSDVLPFLIYACIPLTLFVAISLLGQRFPHWQRALSIIAAFLMPLLGLAYPMLGHTGDGDWEILQYLAGSHPHFKAGEELGTLPLHVLATWFGPFSPVGGTRLFCLIAALVGAPGLLFLLEQVRASREHACAPALSWPLSVAILAQPLVFMYAGFLQTTFILGCIAPWVVGLLLRACRSDAHETWPILAAGGLAVSFLVHGVAVTGIAGFVFFWFASSLSNRSHLVGGNMRALRVVALLAVTVIVGEATLYALADHQHWQVYQDPWTTPTYSLWDKWMGLQHLLNRFPAWLWAGEPCIAGQPTVLLTLDWLFLTGAAMLHIVNIPAVTVAAVGGPSEGDGRLLFLGCLGSCLGFIGLYGPHYSYPADLDVILFPGFVVSVVAIGVGVRNNRDRRSGYEWLVLLYSVVCLSGIWALQYSYGNASAARTMSAHEDCRLPDVRAR